MKNIVKHLVKLSVGFGVFLGITGLVALINLIPGGNTLVTVGLVALVSYYCGWAIMEVYKSRKEDESIDKSLKS